jgi:hypothetical protein
VRGPKLVPPEELKRGPVYLPADYWERLDAVAKFHTKVYAALGAKGKVSRNDVIVSFLEWGLDEYWADKGGVPATEAEAETKARTHADALRKTSAHLRKLPPK